MNNVSKIQQEIILNYLDDKLDIRILSINFDVMFCQLFSWGQRIHIKMSMLM